jgi:hypothetical protein
MLVPRQPHRFVAEMKARNLHWEVPQDWMEREDLAIAERVISQAVVNLREVKSALENRTLKVKRHPAR